VFNVKPSGKYNRDERHKFKPLSPDVMSQSTGIASGMKSVSRPTFSGRFALTLEQLCGGGDDVSFSFTSKL
jgi:hypothetical protein